MNGVNEIKTGLSHFVVESACWRFALSVALMIVLPAAGSESGNVRFNRDIRPILSDKCFFCHGPDASERQADLRLDVESEAKSYAIVEGEPQESELFVRITSNDAQHRMPPAESGKRLTPQEIQLIGKWIREGAPYEPYWAYAKPRRHAVPPVKDSQWPAGWIDRFILARLEAENLEPAPEADRITLIRRLSFDLTGLPPTPKQVEQFVGDSRPEAYETVVDRLLASDRYGERMAMYWLDLVRYADTVGYHGDQDQNISPYRDYVIDSFNDNLPLDRFTHEQLAGDLLPESGTDQKIATGYNRMLQTSHEGGVQPKEYLSIYAADRVRNFSNVWMAATMGCCQCHDHKYDPFTARDFYSLIAFFADIDEAQHFRKATNSLPTARPPEISVLNKRDRQRLEQVTKKLTHLRQRRRAIAPAQRGLRADMDAQIQELSSEKDRLEASRRLTMVTVAIEPRTIRLLPRGNWLDDSGPVMQPAVPQFLGTIQVKDRRANRADLADWLTDVEHGVGGLTARVFANRFWYLMFGVAISKTMDDFGGQGEPPEHPELLDNLAVDFYENGWDVKRFFKQIVMSRAYRQSSVADDAMRTRDPYNRMYARQTRYRLPAEMIRDNALAISGLLVKDYGGPSVRPYQPAGYYRHLNFPKRVYESDTDHRQWRRGVYMHWQRQFLHPMLKALDAPSREECTAQRPRSNTPLAALTLLNDPTFVEAARVFAARVLQESARDDDDSRMNFLFQHALSRAPDPYELALLQQLLTENRTQYRKKIAAAEKVTRHGLAQAPPELDPIELAAWTAVTRAVLNMDECITRN